MEKLIPTFDSINYPYHQGKVPKWQGYAIGVTLSSDGKIAFVANYD